MALLLIGILYPNRFVPSIDMKNDLSLGSLNIQNRSANDSRSRKRIYLIVSLIAERSCRFSRSHNTFEALRLIEGVIPNLRGDADERIKGFRVSIRPA